MPTNSRSLSVNQHENEKLQGLQFQGATSCFCECYLHETHQDLTQCQERFSLGSGRERKSIIVMKYSQSVLHKRKKERKNKSLLSRRKDFVELQSTWRKSLSYNTAFPPHLKEKMLNYQSKSHEAQNPQKKRPTKRLILNEKTL